MKRLVPWVPLALALTVVACASPGEPAALPPSAASEPVQARGASSPDAVAKGLWEAQQAGDRVAAEAIALPRVVRLLFDPLPAEADPKANSMGAGPEPCVRSQDRDEYICYFRDSVVKIIVRKEAEAYVASWALFPTGHI